MVSLSQAFHFWDTLSELQRAEILDGIVIRQYETGSFVQKRPGLYLVTDGNIVAYSGSDSGRRTTLFSARWMEAFILTPELLADANADTIQLQVREASELQFIPYDIWRQLGERMPVLAHYSVEVLSEQMGTMIFGIQTRMEKDISKRLASVLLRYHEKDSHLTGNLILVSHEEMATVTGTTREVVTRNISYLKEAGLIETGRGKIRIIDPEKLKEYIHRHSQEEQEA